MDMEIALFKNPLRLLSLGSTGAVSTICKGCRRGMGKPVAELRRVQRGSLDDVQSQARCDQKDGGRTVRLVRTAQCRACTNPASAI
jgi:hypothetical protein